jgi:hypothetical protein
MNKSGFSPNTLRMLQLMPKANALLREAKTWANLHGLKAFESRLEHFFEQLDEINAQTRESRFHQNDTIITTQDANENDWAIGSRDNCRWGVHGIVKKVHYGHDVVYEVEHDDGEIAYYSEKEVMM